jgi:cytochrome c553
MTPTAKTLSDQDIADVAAYYAQPNANSNGNGNGK